MNRRIVVNVSTGEFVAGALRLRKAVEAQGAGAETILWLDTLPSNCPSHSASPFAFKPYALREASDQEEHCSILWVDASIYPIRSMAPLWQKIENDGYYLCNNGWSNGEWTADTAYDDLGISREDNWKVKHCVAGVIGLDTRHQVARSFMEEYLRLSRTKAFQGPTWNSNHPESVKNRGARPCGPPEVRGHRHDQTAASVIAWKLGMQLSDPPAFFSYKGGGPPDPRTILYAVGPHGEIESY